MENQVSIYLMGYKGKRVLEKVINDNLANALSYVVLATDKNVENDYFEEIKELCIKEKINYFLRGESLPPHLGFSIAIGWRWILPIDFNKLIVLHDSLLPKYKGFNPLVSYLLNKEERIGATAFMASGEFDSGPVIFQSSVEISYPIKVQDAILKMANLYSEIVSDIIKKIKLGEPFDLMEQDQNLTTYSIWRDEKDYEIDWSWDSSRIKLFIDSLGYPYKGASSYIEGKKIRIFDSEEFSELILENSGVGKILFLKEGFPLVVCGKGGLLIKDAIYEDTSKSIFPLKKIRLRFN